MNEGLEHEVTIVHITDKSGRSMHKLQASEAITSLESEALSSKFTYIRSQTRCEGVSVLAGNRDKLHRRILVFD